MFGHAEEPRNTLQDSSLNVEGWEEAREELSIQSVTLRLMTRMVTPVAAQESLESLGFAI